MIVPKGSVPKMPITIGESGCGNAAVGHSTNFAKLKMKPALIRYSEESDDSRVCVEASGAQLSETLSATIKTASRLNINFIVRLRMTIRTHPAIYLKCDRKTSKNAALYFGR